MKRVEGVVCASGERYGERLELGHVPRLLLFAVGSAARRELTEERSAEGVV